MRVLSGILFLLLVAQSGMLAQVPVQLADRGPRFLLASHPAAKPTVVDARKVAVLRQRISLDLEDVTLEEALTSISRQAGLRLMYSKAVVPLESRVRLQAKGITVAGALTEVLFDAGVDVLLTANGQAVLTRRAVTAKVEVQGGSIVGRVTDAKTGQGLEGTEVLVDGTRWRTLSGTDGQYRVAEVDTGTYVVTVRRIGYTRQSRSVTVVEGQETTADFALAALVTKLDELVTTGTVIPTELKALPTPVSVITSQDFASQRPRTVGELFRQQIPTAISWDLPSSPQSTTFSVRGASKLSGTVAAMKVFVDGIPLSDFTNARVDPNSIARAEVIRGPQAAAIYGSDALGGVIQMFTKRGDSLTARPNVNGEAALGIVQTPYAGYRSELRQEYRGSLLGGGPGVSYYFGAGYDRTPDWVEPESGQSNTSVYGGMHVSRGVLTADASGR
jgi:outer membrane receptor protein involved in Fe transport